MLEDVAAVDAEGVLVRMIAAVEREADEWAAADVLRVQFVDLRRAGADGAEKAGVCQHGLADGLKEKARADRFENGRLFEERDVEAALEEIGGEQAGHAAADDGDALAHA